MAYFAETNKNSFGENCFRVSKKIGKNFFDSVHLENSSELSFSINNVIFSWYIGRYKIYSDYEFLEKCFNEYLYKNRNYNDFSISNILSNISPQDVKLRVFIIGLDNEIKSFSYIKNVEDLKHNWCVMEDHKTLGHKLFFKDICLLSENSNEKYFEHSDRFIKNMIENFKNLAKEKEVTLKIRESYFLEDLSSSYIHYFGEKELNKIRVKHFIFHTAEGKKESFYCERPDSIGEYIVEGSPIFMKGDFGTGVRIYNSDIDSKYLGIDEYNLGYMIEFYLKDVIEQFYLQDEFNFNKKDFIGNVVEFTKANRKRFKKTYGFLPKFK